MIRSRSRQSQISRTALIAITAVFIGLLAPPVAALARAISRAATKTVRYHGATLTVPASWPVLHLSASSHVCVRFNRHAVYLGQPGTGQNCPIQAAGRTEAILISPASYRGALLTPLSRLGAGHEDGSMMRLDDRRHQLVITATWNRDPAVIRRALGLRSLRDSHARHQWAPADRAPDPGP